MCIPFTKKVVIHTVQLRNIVNSEFSFLLYQVLDVVISMKLFH